MSNISVSSRYVVSALAHDVAVDGVIIGVVTDYRGVFTAIPRNSAHPNPKVCKGMEEAVTYITKGHKK